MFKNMKPLPKAIIIGAVVAGALYGANVALTKFKPASSAVQATSSMALPSLSTFTGGGDELKVSIVSFHGYAPALVANGNSLSTQPGSDASAVNADFSS
jgi:hypothetical protein